MMDHYLNVWSNFFNFSGRARRAEYWTFHLFNTLVLFGLAFALGMVAGKEAAGPFAGLFMLASLMPGLAVAVRRMHDIDKSGWNLLLGFIPLIGPILILFFAVKDGTRGENRFGPDPKAPLPAPSKSSVAAA